MNLNRIFLAISLYLCVFFNLSSSAADWSHAEISLIKGDQYHDNSNEKDIKKTIITLQYASGYKYGQNFFFIDAIKADANDNRHGEIYGEYYHTISLAKIKGYDWSKDLIRDLGLKGGINYGAKNSPFGPNPEVYLAGPSIDWNVPGFSFLNLSILAYVDNSTYSGFGRGYSCGSASTTYIIAPSWKAPLSVGNHKFSFEGFLDIIGKHGDCEEQVIFQPQFRWDVGNYFGQPGTIFVGVEYQYWKSKYGIGGRKESFPQALLSWKF